MIIWAALPMVNMNSNPNESSFLEIPNENEFTSVSVNKYISCSNQSKITHVTIIFLFEYFRFKK